MRIETYSHQLSAAESSNPALLVFGRNRGLLTMNVTQLGLSRVPEPDPCIIQWASAWVSPGVTVAYHYLRTPGYNLEFCALTGNSSDECLAPIAAENSSNRGLVVLRGPLKLPFGLALLICPYSETSTEIVRARIAYA